jgi:hypothetical protein
MAKSKDYISGEAGSTNYTDTITGGSGSSGTLTGTGYGYDKPDTADPSSSAAAAISGTSSNLASLYNLSSSFNTASAQQAVDTQNILTPGYSGNMSKWASDISDLLSGKVSDSTKYSLQQAAAERGISTGTSGSQSSDSAYLRALGLTSEGLQQTGASELASMIGSSAKGSTLDMSQYLTSASDQQSAQQYANTIAASPSSTATSANAENAAQAGVAAGTKLAGTTPSTASTGGSGSSIASLLSSILGNNSGSGGYGGGGSIVGGSNTGNTIQDIVNSITGTGTTNTDQGATGYSDVAANPNDYYDNSASGYADVPSTGD